MINNRGLEATYERLGIAQADLVQAGLLDNPKLSLRYLFGDQGDLIEASILQEFMRVFTLSARKKIGAAAARQASLDVAREVIDVAVQVRASYFSVLADAQALELFRQVTLSAEAAAELASRQREAGTLARSGSGHSAGLLCSNDPRGGAGRGAAGCRPRRAQSPSGSDRRADAVAHAAAVT